MKKRSKEFLSGYLLTAPMLMGCLIFYGIPFVMVVRFSFKKSAAPGSAFVGTANYVNIMENDMFRMAFGNTFRFLAISLPLILVVSYAIALFLKKQVDKHQLLKSVLLFPYIMPVVGTVLLVETLFENHGLLNALLNLLGLPVQDWLESPMALAIVIVLYLWKNTGYNVIILLAGLMTLPEEQYTSASLDGANGYQKFRYITMPQMWHSVFITLVFSLINAFKCFREIFLVGGKHPNTEIYMLQHFINNSFENLNYNKLSIAAVLLFIPLVVLIGAGYAWVNRKEAYKG